MGKIVFEHIVGHAKNVVYQKAFRYPLLIYGILTAQKPHLVIPIDILRLLIVELHITHNLYKGHYLQDVPSRKNRPSQAGKLEGKVSETIPKSRAEAPSSSHHSKK